MAMLEHPLQNFLLDYLSTLKGGFVCKIELSGKPVYRHGRLTMMPFKNKYYRVGMSDILFIYKSKIFFFEVKREKDYALVVKNMERFKLSKLEIPKYLHHLKDQYDFIESVKKSGGFGGFVSNLEQVKEILNES